MEALAPSVSLLTTPRKPGSKQERFTLDHHPHVRLLG
jgi:hypothetical protein